MTIGYYDQSYPPSVLNRGGGNGQPGDVLLSVADGSGNYGTEVGVASTLDNQTDQRLTNLTGHITVDNTLGAKASDLKLRMLDFNGPGADVNVTFTEVGHTLVGQYGPFALDPNQQGATTDAWVLGDHMPEGDYDGTTEIRQGSTVLDSDDWTLTVTGIV